MTTTKYITQDYITSKATGRTYWIDARGIATPASELTEDDYIDFQDSQVRHCVICDAAGHGYPGGGPCPLEDRGWADADEELRYR